MLRHISCLIVAFMAAGSVWGGELDREFAGKGPKALAAKEKISPSRTNAASALQSDERHSLSTAASPTASELDKESPTQAARSRGWGGGWGAGRGGWHGSRGWGWGGRHSGWGG